MDSDAESDDVAQHPLQPPQVHQNETLSLESLLDMASDTSIFKLHEFKTQFLPEDAKFPLFKSDCKFLNPHPHQINAVEICMRYLFSDNPDAFENLDNTSSMQRIYAAIDKDVDRNDPDDLYDVERKSTSHGAASSSSAPQPATQEEAALVHVARVHPVPGTISCKMSVPCGGGKTAIMLLLAIIHGGNCLIVTNNVENALNILKTIIFQTNIHLVAPVRLIRPAANDKQFASEKKGKNNQDQAFVNSFIVKEDSVSDGDASRRHFLSNSGINGVTIADVCSFKAIANSSDARSTLRRLIFQSHWRLVQFDEADAVSTKDFREAMENGSIMNFDDGDGRGNILRRVPLCADHIVYLSGTWHRGLDDDGRRFLRDAGKMIYMCKSVDLEETGLLAKVAIASIVCKDDDWTMPFLNDRQNDDRRAPLRGMSVEKCRVLERLVTMHLFYGHKIMIFSRYVSQVDSLAKMFPNAFVVKGATSNREELKEQFKAKMGAIWATTTIGDRGFDVPDVQVVINLSNYGESPGKLFQRMGRALRALLGYQKKAWFYDLLSPIDQPFAASADRASILSAPRYSILVNDGYGDRVRVMKSEQVKELVLAELELESEQLPSIAYDYHVVQTNHMLCFYRAFSCKDRTTFDAAAGEAKADKKPKAKQVSSHQRLRSIIAKGGSATKMKAALDNCRTSKPSTSLTVRGREPVASTADVPSFMNNRVHCKALQAILAASPNSVVGVADADVQHDLLWKITRDIQEEAEAIMRRVDGERSAISQQVFASLEPASDGEVPLQDRCGFLF